MADALLKESRAFEQQETQISLRAAPRRYASRERAVCGPKIGDCLNEQRNPSCSRLARRHEARSIIIEADGPNLKAAAFDVVDSAAAYLIWMAADLKQRLAYNRLIYTRTLKALVRNVCVRRSS